MDKEDREVLGAAIGLVLGGIGALWLVSWLFHLGPAMEGPWWALAYYITAIVVALATWLVSAGLIYCVIQRTPLSARGEPYEG